MKEQPLNNELNDYIEDQKKKVLGVLNSDKFTRAKSIEDEDDLVVSDKESMVAHNKEYTSLLAAYVKNAENTLKSKQNWKFAFFLYSLILLGLLTVAIIVFAIVVYINSDDKVVDLFSISTVAISFLSSIIVIPHVITQYLFSQEEEKNMSEIIGNLQKYDLQIREKGITK